MINFPNAKINLGLNITEKRNDGFHNLETVFFPLKVADILEIQEQRKSKTCNLTNSGFQIDSKADDNLCCRAYNLISEEYRIPGIDAHLHKIIPFGSGLGGGSSDAAFTLLMINQLFNLQLSNEQLFSYAESLGADVPFFLQNIPSFACEKGNKISKIRINLKGYFLVLVVPPLQISTKFAYNGISPNKRNISLKEEMENRQVEEWRNHITNDFEYHIFQSYPKLKEMKTKLYDLNAVYASMSGSGSALYGIFSEQPDVKGLFQDSFVWQEQI